MNTIEHLGWKVDIGGYINNSYIYIVKRILVIFFIYFCQSVFYSLPKFCLLFSSLYSEIPSFYIKCFVLPYSISRHSLDFFLLPFLITWANVNTDLSRYMASLVHNDLTHWKKPVVRRVCQWSEAALVQVIASTNVESSSVRSCNIQLTLKQCLNDWWDINQ